VASVDYRESRGNERADLKGAITRARARAAFPRAAFFTVDTSELTPYRTRVHELCLSFRYDYASGDDASSSAREVKFAFAFAASPSLGQSVSFYPSFIVRSPRRP